jgi:ATP-dependent Clp protease ATP-binding subunit ClpA
MMYERFSETARHVVVRAQEDARRLGHPYIGCEHLLLAAAATGEPAGMVLRDHGATPERIEAVILRTIGRGRAADPLGGLDSQALASIGIDLDTVRARIEEVFGPGALTRDIPAAYASRRPAWGKGPLAELTRRRRQRRARRHLSPPAGPRGDAPLPPSPAQIPFTVRAKESLELALREAKALHDSHIGVQHLSLALLALRDGMVPVILTDLGTPADSLRVAILARYLKAS